MTMPVSQSFLMLHFIAHGKLPGFYFVISEKNFANFGSTR